MAVLEPYSWRPAASTFRTRLSSLFSTARTSSRLGTTSPRHGCSPPLPSFLTATVTHQPFLILSENSSVERSRHARLTPPPLRPLSIVTHLSWERKQHVGGPADKKTFSKCLLEELLIYVGVWHAATDCMDSVCSRSSITTVTL